MSDYMFGVIMAGGQGSRLYPLTANRPKPMVEVIGRPVIEYVKDAMVDAGVSNIIVTTGYKGDMLEELVDGWCSEESQLESSVNQESTPMGTAGSVRLLLDQLQDTFIVGSGDSVLSCDLKKLVERHKTSNAKVTMALWEVENPSEFGIVGLSEQQSGEVDGSLEEGYVVRFKEKPKAEEAFSNVINAGLYIIEPEALALVPEGEKYDFSKQLFPKLLEMGWPIYAKKIDGVWFDVGSPGELIRAQQVLMSSRDSLPFPMPKGKVIGSNGFEFEDSDSKGENQGSVISSGVCTGEHSIISNSLIMSHSVVGDNCKIEKSVIGQNVSIEDSCSLSNCVIGDNVVVEKGTILENSKLGV
jgi:mannose-1-phosphate guanylyltransferase